MHRVDEDRDGDSGDLFDRQELRHYLVFVAGSVRRRKRLVAAVLTSIVALTIGALFALPRTYHVEAKLLAQRSQVLAVRGDGPDAVAPTRGAAETILRRDNLISLVRTTDLVQHYHEHRALSQRALDAVVGLLAGPGSEEDRIDAMVELLEKRLVAWTSEGTVSIAVDWPDARMACRLVDAAQHNFLEERYEREITALAESISIIGSHAVVLTANIDAAVAGIEKLRDGNQAVKPGGAAAAAVATPGPLPPRLARGQAVVPTPEVTALKLAIEAKQRIIDDLEQARRHRLGELQTRLLELRATYTENHPVLVDLQQTIASMSAPSPQVKALSQGVASLRADYEAEHAAARIPSFGATFTAAPALGAFTTPPPLPTEILRLDQELREDRDPATVYARAELRDAMDKYAALRAQVQAAQIDLETAQAAFKYRYSVLTPARLPRRPARPNVPLVLLAALLAAAGAAVLAAVLADLRAGRLVERWQVEALLGRPILGELHLGQRPGQDPS